MAFKRDSIYSAYPAADARLPDGDPLGREEIVLLIWPATASNEVEWRRKKQLFNKWCDRLLLPPFDGPRVNGGPTWRRPTILAWIINGGMPDRTEAPPTVLAEARALAAAANPTASVVDALDSLAGGAQATARIMPPPHPPIPHPAVTAEATILTNVEAILRADGPRRVEELAVYLEPGDRATLAAQLARAVTSGRLVFDPGAGTYTLP